MNCKIKFLIISFIFLLPILLISQVRVGNFPTASASLRFKKLKKKNLNRFINAPITTFILPKNFPIKSYEDLLNQVWDVTPFRVIYHDDPIRMQKKK